MSYYEEEYYEEEEYIPWDEEEYVPCSEEQAEIDEAQEIADGYDGY